MKKIDVSDQNNYVTCKICSKKLRYINIYHLKTHDITEDEYKLRYGGPMVCQNTMQSFVSTGKRSACKKKNRGYVYSVEEDEEIVKRYLNSDSIAEISRSLCRNPKTVSNVIKRKGIDVSSNEARRAHTKYKKESKWSYEKCIEVAKQCSGRGEFRRKYQGAFSQAKKWGGMIHLINIIQE